jgi:multiple sugar transport system substrate-binding protein
MTRRLMPGDRGWELPLIWAAIGTIFGVVAVLVATGVTALVNDPTAFEDGEIVVLSGRDDSIGGQRQVLIDQWNELHPDNRARIVELSELADAQRSEMLARAQSGGGGIDVYNLDVTWTAEFADAGHIRSLDESRLQTGGFLDGPLETCRYRGRLWALPFNTDVGLLYYRADLLDHAPATWDELEADVERVRRETGGEVDGYAGQLADYEGLTVTALEAIWGAGGSVVDDEGAVEDEGPFQAAIAGLGRLQAIAPAGVPALDETESIQLFRSGRALFMRNWPVAYRSLTQDAEGGSPIRIGIAPLPGPLDARPGHGVLGGQNLAVSAQSTRPRAAQALIEFLTSERSQQLLFERGGLPATREVVYFDQAVRENHPYVETLRDAIGDARPRPVEPHYARFSEVFRAAVDGYLRQGSEIPDDFPEQLADALQGRLAPPGDG